MRGLAWGSLALAAGLVVLHGCVYIGPYDYISLEGFPSARVEKVSVAEWVEYFPLEIPVEYSIRRRDYELGISIGQGLLADAIVTVRSARPGIAITPGPHSPDACLVVGPYSQSITGPQLHLQWSRGCEELRVDRLVMRFIVLDALGPIAEESIPFRLKSAGIREEIDAI